MPRMACLRTTCSDLAGSTCVCCCDRCRETLSGIVYTYCMLTYIDLTRQTARVPGCDRTDARRVCASAPGLCCGLCCAVSARQDLGRQGAPTPERRRRQRRLATDGRQTALYPRLPEDQSVANHAWLAIRAEPTPDPLLDSSLAARLATRLSRSRHGAGARREPGCHQPPGAGGRP